MKKSVLQLVAGAAMVAGLMAGASAASAAAYTLSPLPVGSEIPSTASAFDSNAGSGSTGTFTDTFSFVVGGDLNTALGGLYFERTPGAQYQIATTDLTLFEGVPGVGTPTQLATTGVVNLNDTSTGVQSTGLTQELTPGLEYFLSDTITVPGGKLGSYTISAIATPMSAAPEPAAWALLFGGVAMVGLGLRYRRRSTSMLAV